MDLTSFDTSEILDASEAFSGCNNLVSVKMDNFDTTKTTSLNSMFRYCSSLTSLYLPKFNTLNIDNDGLTSIFEGCEKLKISVYRDKCANLIPLLPSYVDIINL